MAHPLLVSIRRGAAAVQWLARPAERAALWSRVLEHLLEERERWFLWLPVGVGVGVALYFALGVEPPAWLGIALLLPIAVLLGREWQASIASGGTARLPALIALTAVLAGLTAAQLRTHTVAAPVLERRGAYMVEGEVALVEARVRGQRLLLADPWIEDVAPQATPARIRFSIRDGDFEVWPGDRVRARVMLMPPSPPAAPGDFDFARRAFFMGLGAVGYALGEIERTSIADRRSLVEGLAGVRQRIAEAIGAAVEGAPGAVATALLTGLRGGIPDGVWWDMQAAGIAHLLAISGLHLGLVAGTLFFGARVLIALSPPLALRVPGKKVAAAGALAGALVYLFLTGGTVPTQRAFIMTALVLIAVMVDRNPFSMRLVAVAAMFVLAWQPDSLLGPSFQMSFAAVAGLIAVYETGVAGRAERGSGLDWRLLLYVAGVAATTVIATVATAPFAIYHFDRVATYGIVANLVAVPLTAFWIMPLGLAGLILLPFGLGALCFVPMGHGIAVMLEVAATVADWPGAAVRVPQPPASALVATVAGGLWLCLWRRPWRRLGLIGPAAGMLLALLHEQPDILVDRRGQLVAVQRAGGELAIAPWDRDDWVTDGWIRRYGRTEAVPWPKLGGADRDDLRCDPLGCLVAKEGRTVALARRAEALEEDCANADLVIGYPRLERCARGTPLIGPDALWRSGGLAVWIDGDGVATLTVREHRGARPWAE